jgi:hypothetical protein
VVPRWLVAVAVVTAVVFYAGWTAAAGADFSGQELVALVCAGVFWLSIMVLAAYGVQRAVDRYRDRN